MIEGIDVSDSDSGTKLVKAVQEKLGEGGTLDYVICNAGCVCCVCPCGVVLIFDIFHEM